MIGQSTRPLIAIHEHETTHDRCRSRRCRCCGTGSSTSGKPGPRRPCPPPGVWMRGCCARVCMLHRNQTNRIDGRRDGAVSCLVRAHTLEQKTHSTGTPTRTLLQTPTNPTNPPYSDVFVSGDTRHEVDAAFLTLPLAISAPSGATAAPLFKRTGPPIADDEVR